MSMVRKLNFKDPLLGLANVKWGRGIRIIKHIILTLNTIDVIFLLLLKSKAKTNEDYSKNGHVNRGGKVTQK
jgi:hypothetical protein